MADPFGKDDIARVCLFQPADCAAAWLIDGFWRAGVMDVGFQFDWREFTLKMLARDLQHSSRPVVARKAASDEEPVPLKLSDFIGREFAPG